MGLKCQQIIEVIEKYAPKKLAEEWDNVGLQIGSPSAEIEKVMVTLDVDDDVINEAINLGVKMIVAHHPLIFRPIKNIRFDQPLGGLINKIIKNEINLYIAHTNLDSANRGVNFILAEKLGLENTEVLAPSTEEKLVKLVVFIPEDYVDQVMKAISEAGAGWIGNYSHCTFQSQGTGTFKPLEGAQPLIGQVGEIEQTPEIRLETILPEKIMGRVLKAMLKAHPYEEVAFDIYPLINQGEIFGLGKIGYLPEPIVFQEFILRLKQSLGLESVQYGGVLSDKVQKIAVCGGSGASLIGKAIIKGADVLVTGDIKYHEGQDCLRQGLNFINAGHHETETLIVPVLADYLNEVINQNRKNVDIYVSKVNTNPYGYF